MPSDLTSKAVSNPGGVTETHRRVGERPRVVTSSHPSRGHSDFWLEPGVPLRLTPGPCCVRHPFGMNRTGASFKRGMQRTRGLSPALIVRLAALPSLSSFRPRALDVPSLS
jgi:hypothetical protein